MCNSGRVTSSKVEMVMMMDSGVGMNAATVIGGTPRWLVFTFCDGFQVNQQQLNW